jgi:hypothetical protein
MLAFANVVDLFAYEFTGLSRLSFTFFRIFMRPSNGVLFRHCSLLQLSTADFRRTFLCMRSVAGSLPWREDFESSLEGHFFIGKKGMPAQTRLIGGSTRRAKTKPLSAKYAQQFA